ncbi:permease-like cell division protein FtsX [Aneurinibacillus aneurinilyticus]|jgi:cell division transport system permease protein|uniref:Cell division protein FtsX n=2 Tax=Aneurinibacillus aneurinilyticus TaxID=1391 RepID=A0A848CXZ9_ANEAE|nr:permease-like cell division protein FtsX [Aneurinibacillus aneurinilyticus]ERI04506.1 cell division protein FtsX [Aneurinibacillus aneurinilyticus ATCC 12856]MCI1693930.1 permease-like cell division protein FtsX [Aneurinibacillus aneurinilyticus]MED0670766.1 permease-like cell division protein FtsX [Aneurinibacillus aneurinilyticus]MED0706488.1 permease-like cell division protein FtsX [Aneurinibacillus aneurinilyticus]MED0721411.1 permease-like cell division protein FtsX [Aneurinibacillus a
MKTSTITRHLREGFKNLGRNGWMTFASVSAVTITLLILGVFLLLAMNIQHLVQTVEKQVEIRVSLDVTADQATVKKVEGELKKLSDAAEVTFIPKAEGLQNLKKSFGEKGVLFNGLEKENPLPDSFIVKAKTPQQTGSLAQKIQKVNGVKKVNYAEQTTKKLFAITDVVRLVIIAFIIALAFTAMFLIANTIKLTIVARRHEIEIMKLVGATNGFIRWPFFVEGALMGILGALLPIAILTFGYAYLTDFVEQQLALYFLNLLPMYPLALQISLILLGIGAFIGVWGSLMSVRRFLRI